MEKEDFGQYKIENNDNVFKNLPRESNPTDYSLTFTKTNPEEIVMKPTQMKTDKEKRQEQGDLWLLLLGFIFILVIAAGLVLMTGTPR